MHCSRGKQVLEANAIEKLGDSFWRIFVQCGDGRNDSPGHSAKYCMSTLKEQFLDVTVEVNDKRETGKFQPTWKYWDCEEFFKKIADNIVCQNLLQTLQLRRFLA